jgi:dihydroxyacetone kinase-like predicted kinase
VSDQGFTYVPVDPSREYGFVAVAAGDGIKKLFEDLGVDKIVNGGQTMNPSTDDILSAVHATPPKRYLCFPTTKNIIMAAEQATKLADRNIVVLHNAHGSAGPCLDAGVRP